MSASATPEIAPGIAPPATSRMRRWRRHLQGNAALLIVLALLVLMLIVGSSISGRFSSANNLFDVWEQATDLALVSLGQTMAVLTGGIDLSVGSLISMVICFGAGILNGSGTWLYPVLAGMALLGLVVGALNGLAIVSLRVHPLIITLGTGAILQGITLLYAMGPVGSIPPGFDGLAYATIGPVPVGAVVVAVLFVLTALFLRTTRFGRYVYAVGGDASAAKLIGLPKTQVIVFVYAFSGLIAALTGIYLLARFGSGQPYAGANYTLASITPVVVGGTLLSGGRGGVIGSLFGAYLVALLKNLLNFMDVSSHVQMMAQGLIIILAVSVYVERRRGIA